MICLKELTKKNWRKLIAGAVIGLVVCLSWLLCEILLKFQPYGHHVVLKKFITEVDKNIYLIDLDKIIQVEIPYGFSSRPKLYSDKQLCGDRVQVTGQGMTKPDFENLKNPNILRNLRIQTGCIYLFEQGKIYFSLTNGTNPLESKLPIIVTDYIDINKYLLLSVIIIIGVFYYLLYWKIYENSVWLRRIFVFNMLLLMLCYGFSFSKAISPLDFEGVTLVKEILQPSYNMYKNSIYSRYQLSDEELLAQKKGECRLCYAVSREPMPSFLFSSVFFLDPLISKDMELDRFIQISHRNGLSQDSARMIKGFLILQGALLFLVAAGACLFLIWITYSPIFGVITGWLIMTSPTLITASLGIRDTNFIALFILWASCCLFLYFQTRRLVWAALSGLFLGCLVLTKASFLYFIPFVVAYLIYDFFRKRVTDDHKNKVGNAVMIIVIFIVCGSWMVRNYIFFGDPSLNSFGSMIAGQRLIYNTMTADEFGQAFKVWFPENSMVTLAETDPENRFLPINPNGFRMQGLHQIDEYWDKEQANRQLIYLKRIFSDFIRHAVATVPLMYRGNFPEYLRIFGKNDAFIYRALDRALVNFALLGSIILLTIYGIRKEHYWTLGICALYIYIFNSFFVHNIPRYNYPLIPLGYVTLAICLYKIKQFFSAVRR